MIVYNGLEIPENLGEMMDLRYTCLAVWDVQKGLTGRIFNPDEFKGRLRVLVEGLRGKLPVVYTLITPPPREFQSSWALFAAMRRFKAKDPSQIPVFMAPGSPEREVAPEVKPHPGDMLLEKPATSIFVGTNFEALMRARGIRTILFTGIATEIGVEHSARDAAARGFYPVVITDCVSSADKEAHERSLANMGKMFVTAESGEILKLIH